MTVIFIWMSTDGLIWLNNRLFLNLKKHSILANVSNYTMAFTRNRDKRRISHVDFVREAVEDVVHGTREIITRTKQRIHHKFYTSNEEDRFTSKRARVISVFLYAACVSISAILIGLYYTYRYKPSTERLFDNFDFRAYCLKNSNGHKSKCT